MAYKEDTYYIDRVLHHADSSAFAALVSKHSTMAYNIALRITRNREDAEEVAQDGFIKVYQALETFKGTSKFTTWLFKIVYNLALTKIRKKSLFTGSVDDEHFIDSGDDSAFDALDKIKSKEQHKHLTNAINTLDEIDQLLITMYYNEDLPIEEISDITDVSVSNVKVRLFRARKKIQTELQHNLKHELQSIL